MIYFVSTVVGANDIPTEFEFTAVQSNFTKFIASRSSLQLQPETLCVFYLVVLLQTLSLYLQILLVDT